MYTTIILLLLCAVQAGLFYWKWSEIEDYREIGKDVATVTGLDKNKKYSTFVRIAGKFLKVGKYVLFILIPIVFIINLIVASILGTILSFIF